MRTNEVTKQTAKQPPMLCVEHSTTADMADGQPQPPLKASSAPRHRPHDMATNFSPLRFEFPGLERQAIINQNRPNF